MKPYISTFVVSDDLMEETHPNNNKTLHIINPQNLLRPTFIPGTYSFAVTFGLLGVNPDEEHELEFTIVSADKDDDPIIELASANLPDNPRHAHTSLPPEANGFMFNMDFRNVTFRSEGKYLVKISVNGESVGEFPFLVYSQEKL